MNGHPYTTRSRQFYAPRPDVLIDTTIGGLQTATFRVPMPDSRLRVKLSVLFSPVPGTITAGGLPIDITTQWPTTLWLGLEEIDFWGRIAGPVPVMNVLRDPVTGLYVTRAAPLTIPTDGNVMGWSEEFQSAGDQIFGELKTTFGGAQTQKGRWMLYTRYQPDGLILPVEEWQEVKDLCTPRVITPSIVTPNN